MFVNLLPTALPNLKEENNRTVLLTVIEGTNAAPLDLGCYFVVNW